MIIRLGYVAIALNLGKVTSSSTLTYTRYLKLNKEDRLKKLKEVTYSNIEALEKILRYNIDNNIHFYRMTSNFIPLATHPDVMWDYLKYFKKDLEYIGKLIKDNNLRVDAHPDQFNVINSDRERVVENTLRTLNMQVDLFEAMNYEQGKLVIHIGGAKGGKDIALDRFINNLKNFPKRITDRLILENDDKTFNAKEVLQICEKTNLPMVFDIHHHNCNNCEEDIKSLLPQIFKTWEDEELVPKIHFSSPREFEKDRKHADYIDANRFLEFIYKAKESVNKDFDIMIEAKKKDIALNILVKDLKKLTKDIKFIDSATLDI
ncbi:MULTISPECIES: UV DNA damage repair endonuclease UvsE [Romboutsia]|jgi:UV DNA damage endonuclease|uniref:UV DNA damage repair endonuclease UvsE n=1 Tax=Romboutsia TaxID=1501226 RepID=UPI00216B716B|nr:MULTISPECIES: UV DNA damage repair endonuclease UvsE [Romboutsia]MCI9061667.1 UV DNA damage repair endonuclease UvsE [Romboutsia sp.]